jgi:hypothetical protein
MMGLSEKVIMDYLDAREQGADMINMDGSVGQIQSHAANQGGQEIDNQGQPLCWTESEQIGEDADSDQERKWEAFMKSDTQEGLGGKLLQAMELMEEDLETVTNEGQMVLEKEIVDQL